MLKIIPALLLGLVLGAYAIKPLVAKAESPQYGPRNNYQTQNHSCTDEQKEQMQGAIAERDFDKWPELRAGKGQISQVVKKDNFEKFAQMHELRLQGKTAEADQIRAELGLGQGNRKGGR